MKVHHDSLATSVEPLQIYHELSEEVRFQSHPVGLTHADETEVRNSYNVRRTYELYTNINQLRTVNLLGLS